MAKMSTTSDWREKPLGFRVLIPLFLPVSLIASCGTSSFSGSKPDSSPPEMGTASNKDRPQESDAGTSLSKDARASAGASGAGTQVRAAESGNPVLAESGGMEPTMSSQTVLATDERQDLVSPSDLQTLKDRGRGELAFAPGLCTYSYAARHKDDFFHLVGEFGTQSPAQDAAACRVSCGQPFRNLRDSDFGNKFDAKSGFERFEVNSVAANFCVFGNRVLARGTTSP